jgi:hypothetical protein
LIVRTLEFCTPARHLIEQAGVALVYLGIVATFAAVSLIACVIWLLVW